LKSLRIFLAICLMFAGVSILRAQVVSTNGGAIEGDITDSTGAKLPGATVVISSPETGFTKTVSTDAAGFYSVGPLIPGPYKVRVTMKGFETLEVSTVIKTGTATTGSFKLVLGQASETIEVHAGEVQIDTDQAGVSDVLTREQLQSLPVNGRNFLDIAQIEPGVILQAGSTFDPTKAGYSAISVSGVSGRTTRILLDGQDITDETVGTTIFNVSEGAIGEFQLNRSTQDASGEVTSTGEVLVSTQSGTNRFHGQGFYNFQDARALFADANVIGINTTTGAPLKNPYYQRNQFGAGVGGPIIKDKLFFFADLERIKQASQTPANLGSIFPTINSQYANITTPYKLTYSTGRLDYTGPLGGHYFFRGAYNVDAADRNPTFYELYTNRDNTFGFAGGADFQHGHFTHSFRGSYEKFHNFIADHTQGNSSVYDPIQGFTLSYASQIAFGPNSNVPQATYQSDKQFRYDGSWVKGRHIVRYGYSLNRINGGGFFAAYASSPADTITSTSALTGVVSALNPNGYSCSNGAVGGASCLGDPLNGYDTSSLRIGNGLGGENEFPNFGLKNGGQFDWREGAYVQDSWKTTQDLTVAAGLRWSVDTGRANQDLAPVTCAAIDQKAVVVGSAAGPNFTVPEVGYPTACASASTPIFALFNPSFTGKVHQPYANFAPQAGITYSWGNHKTVVRAAGGFFFENDVFNNASNARNNLLKTALGYGSLTTACSSYSLNFPDGTVHTTGADGVTPLTTLCHESIAAAAPAFVALQAQYQANQAANLGTNGGFIGENLTLSGQYAPNYKTPYGEQYNFGAQRELTKGAILSVDYVHNSTLKIGQSIDINHNGAARTLNQAAAATAIQNTLTITCKGAATVQAAITPGGCAGGSASGTGGKYATISDFAKQGLDSGTTFLGGNPFSYAKKTAVTGVGPLEQAAFPGLNPQLGTGSLIEPIGRSHYDALQIVFKQQKQHPMRGIANSNFQVSYSLSRIVATTTSSDEFFSPAVIDKDNPSRFIGRSALDHKHEISFGGSALFKYGVKAGLIGHFFTASPTTLTLDATSLTNGQIFQTDVTGDGTTGDVAPGTVVGAYAHSINPRNLSSYISNFNSNQAGTLTPAGQAIATSGLISQAQLIQMGAAIQPIAQVSNLNGQTTGVSNPTYRQMDAQISYPISLRRLREGMTLEPVLAAYNVGNFSNFANDTGTLQNTTTCAGGYNNCSSGNGYITGANSYTTQASKRTVRNIGTFAQGAQRTIEYQLKLTF
jgi:hypothetical protein